MFSILPKRQPHICVRIVTKLGQYDLKVPQATGPGSMVYPCLQIKGAPRRVLVEEFHPQLGPAVMNATICVY